MSNNIGAIVDKANSNIHARISRGKNGLIENEPDELDVELESEV